MPVPCCARRCSGCREGADVRDELLDPDPIEPAEQADEIGLRPRSLADFVGQAELKEHLSIILEAARLRGQAADHLQLDLDAQAGAR